MNKRENTPWLHVSSLEGEGQRPALYPYAQLRNILKPGDVEVAVGDECAGLQKEFGLTLIQPVYELIWLLNTNATLFTTHTNVAPRDLKPPFEWARTEVAIQLVCLGRDMSSHKYLAAAETLAESFRRLLVKQPGPRNPTGWMIATGPTPMTLIHLRRSDVPYPYRDEDLIELRGFGCVIRIRGCGSSRISAAQRFGAAVSFVRDAFKQTLDNAEIGRATPHVHFETPLGNSPDSEERDDTIVSS